MSAPEHGGKNSSVEEASKLARNEKGLLGPGSVMWLGMVVEWK